MACNMRKAGRIATAIIGWVIVAVLSLFLIYSLTCRIKGESVRLFGLQADVVQSDSMEPALYKNDLIFAKRVSEGELKKDDIVVYKRNGIKYVHRLIALEGETLITQGDKNSAADDPITFENVEGKVVATFAKVGGVINFFQTGYGIISVLAVIAAIFCIKTLISMMRKEKKIDGAYGAAERRGKHEA